MRNKEVMCDTFVKSLSEDFSAEEIKTFSLVAVLLSKGLLTLKEVDAYIDNTRLLQILVEKGIVDKRSLDEILKKDKDFFPKIIRALSVYETQPALLQNLERKYGTIYPDVFKFLKRIFRARK